MQTKFYIEIIKTQSMKQFLFEQPIHDNTL